LSMSVVWGLGANQWQRADPTDPRKVLAQEVVAAVRTHVPWIARNGHVTESEEKRSLGRGDVGEIRVLGRLNPDGQKNDKAVP